jgi:hypothetical protein
MPRERAINAGFLRLIAALPAAEAGYIHGMSTPMSMRPQPGESNRVSLARAVPAACARCREALACARGKEPAAGFLPRGNYFRRAPAPSAEMRVLSAANPDASGNNCA